MDKNSMKSEVETELKKQIEIESIVFNMENDQISKKNKAYSLDCSIMFVDVRGSTVLTDENSKKNMTKFYKALARVIAFATKENTGDVKQIVGDGFMCLFTSDGGIKSAQKAVDCAATINTYIKDVLNPALINLNVREPIKVGIGICTGNILLAKVGRKGKGKVAVPVFPGSVTNHASKFCDKAKSEEVVVDEGTWNRLKKYKDKFNPKTAGSEEYRAGGLLWEK